MRWFCWALVAAIALLPSPAGAQDAALPVEPTAAPIVAFGGAGVASAGVHPMAWELNPAALGAFAAVAFHRGPAGDDNVLLNGSVTIRDVTLGGSLRSRSWDELASDLGVDGITASESVLGLRASTSLWDDRLAVGVAAKLIDLTYVGHQYHGRAGDAGIVLAPVDWAHFGLAALNFGSLDGNARLPSRIKAGVLLEGARWGIDWAFANDVTTDPRRNAARVWDNRSGLRATLTRHPIRVSMAAGHAAHGRGGDWRTDAYTIGGEVAFDKVFAAAAMRFPRNDLPATTYWSFGARF